MDHDRLFKQLLEQFFAEFLDLFLPEVTAYLEPGSEEFLKQELFTDLTAGDRHEVDLLAKCRFRGNGEPGRPAEGYFLVHVETQASPQGDFTARTFRYFARLAEKHGLPVYPIALFTYDAPLRPEPDSYGVSFPDLDVLAFRFRAIQLNRLSWRDYARRPNPVAAALMAKMKIDLADRPRVKLQCLRLMLTLKLNPAKQALIRDFMDAYLQLSAAEFAEYHREVQAIQEPERQAVMTILNEWEVRGEARGEIRGEARGEAKGEAKSVLILLRRRFGTVPDALADRIRALPTEKLDALLEALLDFPALDDVAGWVAAAGSGG